MITKTRDIAVCAFESARLVMFGGSRIIGAASNLDVAVSKAKLSLTLITSFFPHSASTQPLVSRCITSCGLASLPIRVDAKSSQRKDLERLIASYSVRLALQTQGTLSEPDPPSARPSTKVSQYATSRQRLSVQSLLLQSDFADDSHEIAGPSQATEAPILSGGTQAAHPSGVNNGSLASVITSRNHSWGTIGAGNGQGPPAGSSFDARQEDAGLIFNPWMGFTGSEDMYSVAGRASGLDDEF